MRENAKILLGIYREAGKQCVMLPMELRPILQDQLEVTDQEVMEIGEILKADLREMIANSPDFGEINAIIEQFPKI